jgi:threonine dehydrogenase-like Zn-dependent dehydrogenase
LSKLDEYRAATAPLPGKYAAWQIFGAGIENVGKDDKPSTLPLREPADNEIMLRVDALGLCLSDIKIITQGGAHARLRGRDLATDPTVLGHECSATVVKVGKNWVGKFKAGERYIVQADIYYKGVGYAFGYVIPGGLAQYCYLDERALDGDEGCYLLPVRAETGYSQAALSEPWACVEMSYCLNNRTAPAGGPCLVISDTTPPLLAAKFDLVNSDLQGLRDETYDDIIVQNPTPQLVETLGKRLAKGGCMFLLGAPAKSGLASLDIGRIHYEDQRYYGGGETLEEVGRANARMDLKEGGSALFIGAGGPMGQMHVQRAIETSTGPKLVVVTDLDRGRLDHIVNRFGDMAKRRGCVLETFTPKEFADAKAMDVKIKSLAPNGYDDICILAPVASMVTGAMPMAANNALVNVFAGVGIGSMAGVPVEDLCRGIKIIGSSGSRISDLRKVLEMVEARKLDTNLSVAAIAGLKAAKEGLIGLKEARFPGKTVIYPQIPDLPLTSIEDVPVKIPALKDKLTAEGAWTIAAEKALLEMYAQ